MHIFNPVQLCCVQSFLAGYHNNLGRPSLGHITESLGGIGEMELGHVQIASSDGECDEGYLCLILAQGNCCLNGWVVFVATINKNNIVQQKINGGAA